MDVHCVYNYIEQFAWYLFRLDKNFIDLSHICTLFYIICRPNATNQHVYNVNMNACSELMLDRLEILSKFES